MRLILLVIIASLIAGCAISNGKSLSLSNGKFVLQQELSIQSENGIGVLPQGTVLYSANVQGDSPTFFVLINTKNLDLLKPYRGDDHNGTLIVPLDGFKK